MTTKEKIRKIKLIRTKVNFIEITDTSIFNQLSFWSKIDKKIKEITSNKPSYATYLYSEVIQIIIGGSESEFGMAARIFTNKNGMIEYVEFNPNNEIESLFVKTIGKHPWFKGIEEIFEYDYNDFLETFGDSYTIDLSDNYIAIQYKKNIMQIFARFLSSLKIIKYFPE